MRTSPMLLAFVVASLACAGRDEPGPRPGPSPYAGEERRAIKSLSARDLEDLAQGRGWGLAKVAELNGVPGPLHVLELAAELELGAEQREAVSAAYAAMTGEAIAAGERFIAAESRLSRAFAAGPMTAEALEPLLAESARGHAALRGVHLRAHLRTAELLTRAQRARYAELRGYGEDDPCARVPPGHDPAMWKRHNGCDEP